MSEIIKPILEDISFNSTVEGARNSRTNEIKYINLINACFHYKINNEDVTCEVKFDESDDPRYILNGLVKLYQGFLSSPTLQNNARKIDGNWYIRNENNNVDLNLFTHVMVCGSWNETNHETLRIVELDRSAEPFRVIAREGHNLMWFDTYSDVSENTFETLQILDSRNYIVCFIRNNVDGRDSKPHYAGVLNVNIPTPLTDVVKVIGTCQSDTFSMPELFNLNESISTPTIGSKHIFIGIMHANELVKPENVIYTDIEEFIQLDELNGHNRYNERNRRDRRNESRRM